MKTSRVVVIVAGGLTAVAITAAVVWLTRSDGVQTGPGPFETELADCRERLDNDLQHAEQEYLEETVWHTGDAAELRIGGKVILAGPSVADYECLVRAGRILSLDVR